MHQLIDSCLGSLWTAASMPISPDALPKLTAEDLKDLGVVLGGHRRRLLVAIAALGAAMPAASVTAAPRDATAPTEAERRQLTAASSSYGSLPIRRAPIDPAKFAGVTSNLVGCHRLQRHFSRGEGAARSGSAATFRSRAYRMSRCIQCVRDVVKAASARP